VHTSESVLRRARQSHLTWYWKCLAYDSRSFEHQVELSAAPMSNSERILLSAALKGSRHPGSENSSGLPNLRIKQAAIKLNLSWQHHMADTYSANVSERLRCLFKF
jgi:hypothetical protein